MSKPVLVRVLADIVHEGVKYAPNTLLELSADAAKTLKTSGVVDDNKAAVDYVKTVLLAEVVKHVAKAVADADPFAAPSDEA